MANLGKKTSNVAIIRRKIGLSHIRETAGWLDTVYNHTEGNRKSEKISKFFSRQSENIK